MKHADLVKYVTPLLTTQKNDARAFFKKYKSNFKASPSSKHVVYRWFIDNSDAWNAPEITYFSQDKNPSWSPPSYYRSHWMDEKPNERLSIKLYDLRFTLEPNGLIKNIYFDTTSTKCSQILEQELKTKQYFDLTKVFELHENLKEIKRLKDAVHLKKSKKDSLLKTSKLAKLKKLVREEDPNAYVKEVYTNDFIIGVKDFPKTIEFKIRKTKPKDWEAIQEAIPGLITVIKANLWKIKYN